MEEFVGKVKDAMSKLVVGNGMEPNTSVGPLINHAQFEKVILTAKLFLDGVKH